MVPRDAAQAQTAHTVCSTKRGTRTLCRLVAEMQAASITSMAATPSKAGDRLQADQDRVDKVDRRSFVRINLTEVEFGVGHGLVGHARDFHRGVSKIHVDH